VGEICLSRFLCWKLFSAGGGQHYVNSRYKLFTLGDLGQRSTRSTLDRRAYINIKLWKA
jgi:hypothetical protein